MKQKLRLEKRAVLQALICKSKQTFLKVEERCKDFTVLAKIAKSFAQY